MFFDPVKATPNAITSGLTNNADPFLCEGTHQPLGFQNMAAKSRYGMTISTSPSPVSEIATSSNRNTEGGPNSVKRNDLITFVLITLQSVGLRKCIRLAVGKVALPSRQNECVGQT
jgi:hypothetical protein